MKRVTSPVCTLCNDRLMGSFMHMYWDCKNVQIFWKMVSSALSEALCIEVPCKPSILHLNEISGLNLNRAQTSLFLTGITAAKKMLAQRWKFPNALSRHQWTVTYLDILNMELSVARMHKSKPNTLLAWQESIEKVKKWI